MVLIHTVSISMTGYYAEMEKLAVMCKEACCSKGAKRCNAVSEEQEDRYNHEAEIDQVPGRLDVCVFP